MLLRYFKARGALSIRYTYLGKFVKCKRWWSFRKLTFTDHSKLRTIIRSKYKILVGGELFDNVTESSTVTYGTEYTHILSAKNERKIYFTCHSRQHHNQLFFIVLIFLNFLSSWKETNFIWSHHLNLERNYSHVKG